MRRQREVREAVLGRAGRYQEVAENLRLKEVWVEGRRYVVCHDPEEAAKDAGDREAILQPRKSSFSKGLCTSSGTEVSAGTCGWSKGLIPSMPERWPLRLATMVSSCFAPTRRFPRLR